MESSNSDFLLNEITINLNVLCKSMEHRIKIQVNGTLVVTQKERTSFKFDPNTMKKVLKPSNISSCSF